MSGLHRILDAGPAFSELAHGPSGDDACMAMEALGRLSESDACVAAIEASGGFAALVALAKGDVIANDGVVGHAVASLRDAANDHILVATGVGSSSLDSRSGTTTNDLGRELILKHGGVDVLVSCLVGGSQETKETAASGLECMARVSETHGDVFAAAVAAAGAILPLVALASEAGNVLGARLFAVNALSELGGGNYRARNRAVDIVAAGAIPAFVALARDDPSEYVQEAAMRALEHLAMNDPTNEGVREHRVALRVAGAIPVRLTTTRTHTLTPSRKRTPAHTHTRTHAHTHAHTRTHTHTHMCTLITAASPIARYAYMLPRSTHSPAHTLCPSFSFLPPRPP